MQAVVKTPSQYDAIWRDVTHCSCLVKSRGRCAAELWKETLTSSRLLEYEVWNRIHARKLYETHQIKAVRGSVVDKWIHDSDACILEICSVASGNDQIMN